MYISGPPEAARRVFARVASRPGQAARRPLRARKSLGHVAQRCPTELRLLNQQHDHVGARSSENPKPAALQVGSRLGIVVADDRIGHVCDRLTGAQDCEERVRLPAGDRRTRPQRLANPAPKSAVRNTMLSAIIVAYKTPAELAAAVASLRAQSRPPDEIIIIDNAAAEGEPIVEWSELNGTLIERPPANLGYGAGCNLGAKSASGDELLVLNADVVLTADATAALMERLQSDSRIAVVGPRIFAGGKVQLGSCLSQPSYRPARTAVNADACAHVDAALSRGAPARSRGAQGSRLGLRCLHADPTIRV